MSQYSYAKNFDHFYERGVMMSLPDPSVYTAQDYWQLPDGRRAELISGKLYDLAAPSRLHQELVIQLTFAFIQYIKAKHGECKVYTAPFSVNLYANDSTYVEPDISVICDPGKLTDKGCQGAPDLIIEIVSPGSRSMDYIRKNALYLDAGVREYWIVDPAREHTIIYRYEEDAAPVIVPFEQPATVGIYGDLQVPIAQLLANS